jgi:hypothetical protein
MCPREALFAGVLIYPLDDLLGGTAADERWLHVLWNDDRSQRHADSGKGLQMAADRHDAISLRSPCRRSGHAHGSQEDQKWFTAEAEKLKAR